MVFLYGFVFIKKTKLIAVVLFTDVAIEDSGTWTLTQPCIWTSLSAVSVVPCSGRENNGPLGATGCTGLGGRGVWPASQAHPKGSLPGLCLGIGKEGIYASRIIAVI